MTAPTWTVPGPGVYPDVPADVYHRDPVPGGSLSSTGARRLLPPSCPAHFAYEREHGQPTKRVWDFGRAAHRRVLGVGDETVLVDAPNYRTKAAQQQRDDAHAAGKVPILPAENEQIEAMAAALRQHPTAAALLRPEGGQPEQSAFWRDRDTGVICRARFDWLDLTRPGRLIVPDYKTCASAALDDLQRAIYDHGLHIQAAWYLAGLRALGLANDDARFVFAFQEKRAPYLVTVAEVDPFAMKIGAHLTREALRVYRECTESGRWPGYTDDVAMISLPGWVERQYEMELSQ